MIDIPRNEKVKIIRKTFKQFNEENGFYFLKPTLIMKDNYDAMGVQVKSSKNNLRMLYKSQYNKIKNSELEIAQAKQNLEIAKTNMEIVQKRYDAGYVAQLDYEAAKLNLENEEMNYKVKLINNILLNAQFNAFVSSGAGIVVNG